MVAKTEGSKRFQYFWDYENRLAQVWDRKSRLRYVYDALGRRVQRFIVGGRENTKFIYDGQDVLVDDNSGTLTKYINGAGIDNKLRMQTGTDVRYFLTDHLGSTNALADSSGNITSSASYDSFGNATGNIATRYQYTGREFDSFTGLHYYRARWYDGNLGRFISEDPIGFAGGDINLYGYVKNNPVRYTDAIGLNPNDRVQRLAPIDLGNGWRARVDPYGPDGFEIHVYSPRVNSIYEEAEVGIVSGRYGWIKKHGHFPFRADGIPDDVINQINGLNVEKLRNGGIIPKRGIAWEEINGERVSGNIKRGRYLFTGRNLFGFMGGAIGVIGLVDGLLIDYDTYLRGKQCNRSFEEQFIEDNSQYPYMLTPLGLINNPYYGRGRT